MRYFFKLFFYDTEVKKNKNLAKRKEVVETCKFDLKKV